MISYCLVTYVLAFVLFLFIYTSEELVKQHPEIEFARSDERVMMIFLGSFLLAPIFVPVFLVVVVIEFLLKNKRNDRPY